MTTLRDEIARMLFYGLDSSRNEEAADDILALLSLPQHYDEVFALISRDCTCGFGGFHEPGARHCALNAIDSDSQPDSQPAPAPAPCRAKRWHGSPSFDGPHPAHNFTYGPHGQYIGSCTGRPGP